MRSCKDCPNRVVSVTADGIYLCRSDCKDWKRRKTNEQIIKSKKMKENDLRSAAIEQVQKSKGRKRYRYGHQSDNIS